MAEQGEAAVCVACRYALSQVGKPKLPEQRDDLRGTGRVELGRWIGAGWQLLLANVGVWLLASLLAFAVGLATCMLCYPAMLCGLYKMALRQIRGEQIAVDQVFQGFRRFLPSLGLTLLLGLPIIPVYGFMMVQLFQVFMNPSKLDQEQFMNTWFLMLACYGYLFVCALLVSAVSFFAHPRLSVASVGPLQALRDSWQVVRRNFWMFLFAAFVLLILQGVGVQAAGIGILFTLPLSILAWAQAYVDHFGLEDADLLHE